MLLVIQTNGEHYVRFNPDPEIFKETVDFNFDTFLHAYVNLLS